MAASSLCNAQFIDVCSDGELIAESPATLLATLSVDNTPVPGDAYSKEQTVALYNVNGQYIGSFLTVIEPAKDWRREIELNIGPLTPGLYLVQELESGVKTAHKVLIQ